MISVISLDTIKKKHHNKFLYLLLLQTFVPVHYLFAFYVEENPENYLINIWTVENGLPQNTIKTLLQTNDGFIWIGTPSGLVRFDGVNFKIYNRWNQPTFKSDNITCLYEDQNNVLWVGTKGGGLCALKDGNWINTSTSDGLSSDRVRAIISDLQGDLWVGTDYGLNRINKDGMKVLTTKDGLYDNTITSLAVDSWNNLWIGTFRGGLTKYKKGIVNVYGYKDGLTNLSVRTLFADQQGFLWIGTGTGLFYIKRDEGVVHNISGTAYTPINTIIEISADHLLIGTMVSGVKKMNVQDFSRRTVSDLLPDEFVYCILEDNAGNIWIGTDTGGLVQLKVQRIFNISEKEGLPDNAVSAVFQDRSETIWIGMRDKGLVKQVDDKKYSVINKNSGLTSDRIRIIYEDNLGDLWIGTTDQGLNILNGSILKRKITIQDGLTSNTITAVLQDHLGTIWIGTESGLNSYRRSKISALDHTKNHEINVLLESRQKKIYAGTSDGLYFLLEKDLVPLDQNLSFNYDVISLYEDQFDVLWIGTNGDGLFVWTDGHYEKISKENGLPDNFILSIQGDENSNIWMSSHSGVFWVRRRDLTNFLEKKTSSIHPTLYNESEGMASRQCTGEGQSSVVKSRDGRWYYPTIDGVSVIDPQKIRGYCTIPIVLIEHVFSNDDTVMVEADRIPALSKDQVTFTFTSTEFAAPDKIQFRYKLDGYDDKIRYLIPGSERRINYRDLSSGDHTLHIWGVNNEGEWGKEGTIFSFRINPPLYLNPIFLILFIALSLSFSSALIYVNHRQKRQKQRDKYKTSSLDVSKIAELADHIDDLMEKDKLYLNPDLSLKELSRNLKMHSNYISRIINEHFGMSYNDFINKYRVQEIQKRFADPEYRNNTVLEIMYETGFYSKSVFNKAFKKFTGMTPSEYRKQIK